MDYIVIKGVPENTSTEVVVARIPMGVDSDRLVVNSKIEELTGALCRESLISGKSFEPSFVFFPKKFVSFTVTLVVTK